MEKIIKIEVSREEFQALVKEFGGTGSWRVSNNRGEFFVGKEDPEDPRRKLKCGKIVFVEGPKVDPAE